MQPRPTHTEAEYFALDREAPEGTRYEYDGIQAHAMAGAEPEHNLIKDNIAFELSRLLGRDRCRIMTSDQRVRVDAGFVYPDVVVCSPPQYADTRPRSLVNPELIAEVESPTTGAHDRGWKLDRYLELESLREYWLVRSEEAHVLQYTRQQDQWTLRILRGTEATLHSEAFDVRISLAALYALALR